MSIPRPCLPNVGDGALSRRKSGKDASGTNAGHTFNNVSRGCHKSFDLELFSVLRGLGTDLRAWNTPHNQSRIDISESLPKEQEIPLPQMHQDQQPEPHTRASSSRISGVFSSGK